MKLKRIEGELILRPNQKGLMEGQQDMFLIMEDGSKVHILKGTASNGLSLPKFLVFLLPRLRLVFPRWCEHWNLAVYSHDGEVNEFETGIAIYYPIDGEPRFLSWAESAKLTNEVLIFQQCPKMKRKLIYASIRFWGNMKRYLKKWFH